MQKISSILFTQVLNLALSISVSVSAHEAKAASSPPPKSVKTTNQAIEQLANSKAAGPTPAKSKPASDRSTNSTAGGTIKESTENSDKAKENKKSPEKKAATKKSGPASPRSSIFVPPPPPVVPTLSESGLAIGGSTMIFVGENIDYMPAKELSELKEKTMAEISKQRQTVDDTATASTEKRQRAESFEKLYAEGVVSRRELESSKTESEKADRDLKELKQSLSALEQKFARIEKRLAELAKQKTGSSNKKKH